MTQKRSKKDLVRARQAKTGETYQQAWSAISKAAEPSPTPQTSPDELRSQLIVMTTIPENREGLFGRGSLDALEFSTLSWALHQTAPNFESVVHVNEHSFPYTPRAGFQKCLNPECIDGCRLLLKLNQARLNAAKANWLQTAQVAR